MTRIKKTEDPDESQNMFALDEQLCFALYVASKEMIRKYKTYLDPMRLTYTGYITMLALWEKDGVPIKMLGDRLTLDSGTLTPLLKKLEALGYIQRIRSTEDEREVMIRLTPQGIALREEAEKIPNKVLQSSQVDPQNIQPLIKYLHRFSNHILTH